MIHLDYIPARDEVIDYLAQASLYGNLCLFVGAGFSKELVGNEALSWGELLRTATQQLSLTYDFSDQALAGVGYPEVASSICNALSNRHGVSFSYALNRLKQEVAELTSWYPRDDKISFYAPKIDELSPSWIITTNYDLVLESLLPVTGYTIGPEEPLVSPVGRTPIYHLHGVRTEPEGIVIAREDYTALFRPNEYRQIKLALTLKESTTLLLGYGLGDHNVLTAYDWSKNVFNNHSADYPSDVIQIVRARYPEHAPYRHSSGVLVLETSDLESFFEELLPAVRVLKQEYLHEAESIHRLEAFMATNIQQAVDEFLDNRDARAEILRLLQSHHTMLINSFIPFFERCVDEAFSRSSANGRFRGYAQCLTIILDLMMVYRDTAIPTVLFLKIGKAFHRLASYIGPGMGQSHASYQEWTERKSRLQIRHIREFKILARSRNWSAVQELFSEFNT